MTRHASLALALVLLGCGGAPIEPRTSEGCRVTAHDILVGDDPPPEMFADDVRAHTDAVLALAESCYEERLEARPALAGEERLRVYVSAAQVIRVTIQESTLDDEPLEQCVKQALLDYQLPQDIPRGGVFVHFRLVFEAPSRGPRPAS